MLLATEPLWAALFASLYIGESLGPSDAAGGALLVGACLANSIAPERLRALLGDTDDADADAEAAPTGVSTAPVELPQ